jgi:hypothetical protein
MDSKFKLEVSLHSFKILLNAIDNHIAYFKDSQNQGDELYAYQLLMTRDVILKQYVEFTSKLADGKHFKCICCGNVYPNRTGKKVQYFDKKVSQNVSVLICRNKECLESYETKLKEII